MEREGLGDYSSPSTFFLHCCFLPNFSQLPSHFCDQYQNQTSHPHLIPRVSLLCLLCLLNNKGGKEERPWEQGCRPPLSNILCGPWILVLRDTKYDSYKYIKCCDSIASATHSNFCARHYTLKVYMTWKCFAHFLISVMSKMKLYRFKGEEKLFVLWFLVPKLTFNFAKNYLGDWRKNLTIDVTWWFDNISPLPDHFFPLLTSASPVWMCFVQVWCIWYLHSTNVYYV